MLFRKRRGCVHNWGHTNFKGADREGRSIEEGPKTSVETDVSKLRGVSEMEKQSVATEISNKRIEKNSLALSRYHLRPLTE